MGLERTDAAKWRSPRLCSEQSETKEQVPLRPPVNFTGFGGKLKKADCLKHAIGVSPFVYLKFFNKIKKPG